MPVAVAVDAETVGVDLGDLLDAKAGAGEVQGWPAQGWSTGSSMTAAEVIRCSMNRAQVALCPVVALQHAAAHADRLTIRRLATPSELM